MSRVISLYSTIDICCPHCEEYNEIDDIDISVTIDNTDISRHKDECVFVHQCVSCGRKFKVTPHLDIGVSI